jgi:predicted AAA+ superfamily ATPase
MLKGSDIPVYAHSKLMDNFNRYALTGGMPEVVSKYAGTRDLLSVNSIFSSLIQGYTDDVEKYGRNVSNVQHIRHLLKTGFFYAGQRIKFERFGSSDYRSREMGEAFRTLEKALLIELSYPLTKAGLPAIPDYKRSPRLIWFDTGIVNFMAGIQKEIFGARDITGAWRGIVAEHITGQELLAIDNSFAAKRYFWVREAKNSNAEVDYILSWNGLLIPIEIKSGEGTRLLSLLLYMDTAPHDIAVRVWSSPFSTGFIITKKGKKVRLVSIPFYLVHRLPDILEKFTAKR